MENTTILLIGIAIIIIMFSSFTLSYKNDESATEATAPPKDALASELVSSQQEASMVGSANPDAATYAVYNLPEKDAYMTQTFRDQIDMLRARYYYFDEKMIQK